MELLLYLKALITRLKNKLEIFEEEVLVNYALDYVILSFLKFWKGRRAFSKIVLYALLIVNS